MKTNKLFFTALCALLAVQSLFAQWSANGTSVYYNNGNVGIGTTSPEAKLSVRTSTATQGLIISNCDATGHQSHFALTTADQSRIGFTPESYFNTYNDGKWNLNSGNTSGLTLPISFNTDGLSRIYIKPDGNVGMGTIAPFSGISNKGLHIDRGNHSMLLLGTPYSNSFGGVVQTSDNKHRVFIGANLYDDPVSSWRNFEPGKGGAGISVLADKGTWGTSIEFYTSKNDNAVEPRMTINDDGNVGIGTPLSNNPNAYKLAVNGKIGAKEVQVENTTATWADYVFESDYKLPSLDEVEAFIQKNKHLPEIPSKKEVAQNGHKLGEMDVLLLKKIEELTLYVIEQQKNIKQVKIENQQLKAAIETLKSK